MIPRSESNEQVGRPGIELPGRGEGETHYGMSQNGAPASIPRAQMAKFNQRAARGGVFHKIGIPQANGQKSPYIHRARLPADEWLGNEDGRLQ